MPGRYSDVATAEVSPLERWPSVLLMGGSLGVKKEISDGACQLCCETWKSRKQKVKF